MWVAVKSMRYTHVFAADTPWEEVQITLDLDATEALTEMTRNAQQGFEAVLEPQPADIRIRTLSDGRIAYTFVAELGYEA